MMTHKTRHNRLFKMIAAGMVCLFLFNQIAWAHPDALAPPGLSDRRTSRDMRGMMDHMLAERKGRPQGTSAGYLVMDDGARVNIFIQTDDKKSLINIIFYTEQGEYTGRIEFHPPESLLNYVYVNPDFRGKGFSYVMLDTFLAGIKRHSLIPGYPTDAISIRGYVRNPLLAKVLKKYGFRKSKDITNPITEEVLTTEVIIGDRLPDGRVPIFISDPKKRGNFAALTEDDKESFGIFEVVEEPIEGERLEIFVEYALSEAEPDARTQLASMLQSPHYREVHYETPTAEPPTGGGATGGMVLSTEGVQHDEYGRIVGFGRRLLSAGGPERIGDGDAEVERMLARVRDNLARALGGLEYTGEDEQAKIVRKALDILAEKGPIVAKEYLDGIYAKVPEVVRIGQWSPRKPEEKLMIANAWVIEAYDFLKKISVRPAHLVPQPPAKGRRPTRETLLSEEPRVADYYVRLRELNMELMDLSYQRIEAQEKGDAKLISDTQDSILKLIEDLQSHIQGLSEHTYLATIRKRCERLRQEAIGQLEDAKRFINEKNEPAANACITAATKAISKESDELLSYRLSRRSKQRRVTVGRKKGKIVVWQQVYVTKPGVPTPVREYRQREYGLLWQAFQAVDNQIDTEVDELMWLEGKKEASPSALLNEVIKMLAEAQDSGIALSEVQLGKIRTNINQALERLRGRRMPNVLEKRLAIVDLTYGLRLIERGSIVAAYGLIDSAIKNLEYRRKEVRAILENLEKGRYGPLRNMALERNRRIRDRAQWVINAVKRKHFGRARQYLLGLTQLKDMDEPDFYGLRDLVWQAERELEKLERGERANLDIVYSDMDIVKRRASDSNLLGRLMATFRGAYKDTNMKRRPPAPVMTHNDAFLEVYLRFREMNLRVTQQPRYWWSRFYQPAFISMSTPELFEATSFLIRIQAIDSLDRLLRFLGRRKKKFKNLYEAVEELSRAKSALKDLTDEEFAQITFALSKDYKLTEQQEAVLFEAAIPEFRSRTFLADLRGEEAPSQLELPFQEPEPTQPEGEEEPRLGPGGMDVLEFAKLALYEGRYDDAIREAEDVLAIEGLDAETYVEARRIIAEADFVSQIIGVWKEFNQQDYLSTSVIDALHNNGYSIFDFNRSDLSTKEWARSYILNNIHPQRFAEVDEVLQVLIENIEQHAEERGILIVKISEGKLRLAMVDKGRGFPVDVDTGVPVIKIAEDGRFEQRPGSPGEGMGLKSLNRYVDNLTILTQGHIWTRNNPIPIKRSSIAQLKGTTVLTEMNLPVSAIATPAQRKAWADSFVGTLEARLDGLEEDERLCIVVDRSIGNWAEYGPELLARLRGLSNRKRFQGRLNIITGDDPEVLATRIRDHLSEYKGKTTVVGVVDAEGHTEYDRRLKNNRFRNRIKLVAVDDTQVPNTEEASLRYYPLLPIIEASLTGELKPAPYYKKGKDGEKGSVVSFIVNLLPYEEPIEAEELQRRFREDAEFLEKA